MGLGRLGAMRLGIESPQDEQADARHSYAKTDHTEPGLFELRGGQRSARMKFASVLYQGLFALFCQGVPHCFTPLNLVWFFMTEITPEIVRELLDYDPETGTFVWRERDRKWSKSDKDWKRWNTRFAGKPALATIRGDGYYCGAILGVMQKAHRVAWTHFYGEWPKQDIDHIDGNRLSNPIINLRDVSRQKNMRNMWLRGNNTSGVCGVYWERRRQKWKAAIKVDYRDIWLGSFEDKEEAIAARKAAEREYGFSERHGS